MKTSLIFKTKKLIRKLNSPTEIYEIKENKNSLNINKKYLNKKGKPFSVLLPREIKISPEVAGLIVGEGFIGDRTFIFANSNEKSIDEVLDFLRQFNFPIKMYLEISIKNKPKIFKNQSKNFWEKYLKTKIKRVRLRKEFNNTTRYGTIHLIVNNALFSRLLRQIIDLSKLKIEKNRELSISYLKGIITAEGNINVKKDTNCVYMIRISAMKKEEREHYKKCLERAGIKISCDDMPSVSKQEAKKRGWKTDKGRAGAVIISRWENFVKIMELGLLDLSKDKKIKFLNHFKYNKFTKQFLDFSYFLNKKFRMKEAQINFELKGRSPDRVLTLLKQGYISRKKINKRDYIYKLTRKYINLYNKFEEEGLTPLL